MANEIDVPSIWDYLGQGVQQGIQQYEQDASRKEQHNQAEMGVMSQLYNQGAIDAEDFNKAAQQRGYNIKVQPSKQQNARAIIKNKDINPATGQPYTDEERQQAGLQTSTQQAQDQAAKSTANLTVDINKIKSDYAAGKPITDTAAAALGLPTIDDLNEAKANAQMTALGKVGAQYADTALAPFIEQNGGRIPERGWEPIIQQAAQQYNANRQANGLPPDPHAENFMASHVIDRLVQQKQQDIARLGAQNRPYGATGQVDRMFQAMTGVVESRRKALDDMMRGNPLLSFYLKSPQHQNDPDVIRYKALEQGLTNTQNAQRLLAAGIIPSNAAELLGVGPLQPNGSQADGTTAQGSGGANVQGQQNGGGNNNPPPVRKDVVNQSKQALKAKKLTPQQLKSYVGKKITQAEYDAIIGGQ